MNEPLPIRVPARIFDLDVSDFDHRAAYDERLEQFRRDFPRLAHNGLKVAVYENDDEEDTSGEYATEEHWLVSVKLEETSRHADALREYAPEISRCTLASETVIAMELLPTDEGLGQALGGRLDPAWQCVFVTLQNGQLASLYIEFDDRRTHWLTSDELVVPNITLAAIDAAFLREMEPHGTLVFTPRGNWNMLGVAPDWTHKRHDLVTLCDFPITATRRWRQMTGPMSQFTDQKRAVEIDIQPSRVLATVNDRCLSMNIYGQWEEAWLRGCEYRGPYTLAQIRELCLALYDKGFGSYVILWIINWLPSKKLFADRRKLRWIEDTMTSIQRVLAARQMRRSERIKQAKIK